MSDLLLSQPFKSQTKHQFTPSWFRNGIPQFSIPTKIMHCSFNPLSSLSLHVGGWRGELEAQNLKTTSWTKNKLLETAMRLKKKTVTATLSINKGYKIGKLFTCGCMELASPLLPLPNAHSTWRREPLLPRRDSLSPAPGNPVRGYRIISRSWPCPLPATGKINPVLGQNQDNFLKLTFYLFTLKSLESWKNIYRNGPLTIKSAIFLKVHTSSILTGPEEIVQITKAVYELEVSKSYKVGCYTRD